MLAGSAAAADLCVAGASVPHCRTPVQTSWRTTCLGVAVWGASTPRPPQQGQALSCFNWLQERSQEEGRSRDVRCFALHDPLYSPTACSRG
jgi:hypothetical protein